jgi:RHS repeat-associated protein
MVVTGEDARTVGYTYDNNNRLTKEISTSANIAEEYLYGYDPNGNQLTKIKSSTGASALNGVSSIGLRLLGGSMASGSNEAEVSTYDGFNRLVQTVNHGMTANYSYRPDDLRHSKTVNGAKTTHIWDGSNIVMETDGSNQVQNKYLRGNGLIALDNASSKSYYFHNGHGDVVQLTNSAGTVTKDYVYDAFGNEPEAEGGSSGSSGGSYTNESGAVTVSGGAIVVPLSFLADKVTITLNGATVITYDVSQWGTVGFYRFEGPGLTNPSWKDFVNEGGYVSSSGFKFWVQQPNGTVLNWVAEAGTKSDSDINPFRYAGEYYDSETGNIYLRARYYSPSNICFRFLNRSILQHT